ncbi:MAG: hypothetical protein NC124_17175 [Clostridium sp.]|nr:hypothetical protein [Clostridium sp.]MCM1568563.1 hypothetical protein [Roseburia sp.]
MELKIKKVNQKIELDTTMEFGCKACMHVVWKAIDAAHHSAGVGCWLGNPTYDRQYMPFFLG